MSEKLNTDIPEIANDGMNCKRRITLSIKERQLWYMFIALERLEAIPEIETAVGWLPII